jgi:RNA polymerase sigma-70 factor (family 1)
MLFYKTASNPQLVDLLNNSDSNAFTEIYNRFWKKLLAIAYKHTKDRYLAEEIVQNIFISLWQRKSSLDIKNLDAYLATAIKFAVFKHIYKQNRRKEIIAQFDFREGSCDTEEQLNAKFINEYVNNLTEVLPEKCRMVFKYSRFDDMSVPEISIAMGIAEKTVEAHLTKGLKLMRVVLKNVGLGICFLQSFILNN